MELTLKRHTFTKDSTIGDLLIDGQYECKILEDTDRGLRSSDGLDYILSKKIFAQTAIPYGRYEVVMSYSTRFKRQMPLLLKVRGWDGVRIHWGNKPEDTEGCLITGTEENQDFVAHSHDAFDLIFGILSAACAKGKVFINIEKIGL